MRDAALQQRRSSPLAIILKATLLAGSLDILIALFHYYIINRKDPVVVLRFIASAVFGKNAFSGGTPMALYGLLFHFFITLAWATLFYIIYPTLRSILENNILIALLYATLVWAVMNFLVVPASNAPAIPFNAVQALVGLLILFVAIGLPFSYIMKKNSKK